MDRLRLADVQCPARVAGKKRVLLVDLELETDVTKAAAKDDFRLAVDYWAVENSVREDLESRSWKTLSDAAARAVSVVLLQQPLVRAASAFVRAKDAPGFSSGARRKRGSAKTLLSSSAFGVECRVRVGVPEDERSKPQRIVLDLELPGAADASRAAASAKRAIELRPWLLVEALAAEAASAALSVERSAREARVRAHKSPYVMPKTREVLVELSRKR